MRPYQKDAIRAWSKAGGRGVFAMATGSGKTLTALVLASKVAERNRPLVLVVVCPFINLCRQWIREIATFGVDAVPCFEGRQRWQVQLEEGYQRLAAGLDQVLVIVATNATFQSDAFQCRLRPRVDAGNLHHLLIAGEVQTSGRVCPEIAAQVQGRSMLWALLLSPQVTAIDRSSTAISATAPGPA